MKIPELAKLMNVTEADASGFIARLRVWIEKGYSLDEAIERHMAQMRRFVNRDVSEIIAFAKPIAIDAFYPN